MGKDNNEIDQEVKKLKPGQKYPTPTRGFGDRVFYETLLRQNPESEMAIEWCLNYGVLEIEEAKKLFKILCKRKDTRYKHAKTPPRKGPASAKKKTKKTKTKLIKEEAIDAMMDTGGMEASGTTNI